MVNTEQTVQVRLLQGYQGRPKGFVMGATPGQADMLVNHLGIAEYVNEGPAQGSMAEPAPSASPVNKRIDRAPRNKSLTGGGT